MSSTGMLPYCRHIFKFRINGTFSILDKIPAIAILVLLLVETNVGARRSSEHYLPKKVRRILLIPRERPVPPRVSCGVKYNRFCNPFSPGKKSCKTIEIKRCKQ